MTSAHSSYDVVVVGGGHNGLVAATYLARAGLATLVLERLDHTGGAAVSARPFPGREARLSRYSSLVALMPQELIRDLDLDVRLLSRTTASCTPYLRDGRAGGLLVERRESESTRASFRELTGSDEEYAAWQDFHRSIGEFAEVVAPTLLDPLPNEKEIRSSVDQQVWRDLVQEPLGRTLEARFSDETVRGVVATDGLIGTFASLDDPSLVQNRCFLYHRIGNGTGEWRVPVGGMGGLTDGLARAATAAGAELLTGAGVSSIRATDDGAEVTWHDGTRHHTVSTRNVLSDVAPWVLEILMGREADAATKPSGSQLTLNILVDRLPRLRSGIDPEVAFAGTLHLGEDWGQLQTAYAQAASGQVPDVLPGEIHCHSLTDDSILGSDAGTGVHTLTYFGLHTPAELFDDPTNKERAVASALAALDQHLEEPITSVIARDGDGNPCLEVRTPQDVEEDLAMPGGHIFHGDLDWPWAPPRARLETPGQRWGVATDVASVLLCGSGARRGGAVSGIGGHNAARAVLEAR